MKKQKFVIFIVIGLVLVALPLVAGATTAKSGKNIIVSQTVEGNFFGAGNMIIIDATVNGDVFVAGNNINIRGTVNGDVFAVGSSVIISGVVNGNIRVVGSDVQIMGKVGRNILAAANNLVIGDAASVGGNITCAAATFLLQGTIARQVEVAAGNAVISGTINSDVSVRMDAKNDQSQLTVLDSAKISGNLKYKAPSQADIKPGAKISGKVDYTPLSYSGNQEKAKTVFRGLGFVARGFGFLSLFLAGLVLIYLLPKVTERIYQVMKEKGWSALGIGLAGSVVIPIAGIVLLFAVFTIPLVFASWALLMIAVYFAKAMVGIAVGKWLAERFNWKPRKILHLLLGLVIMLIVGLVPFIGGLVIWLAVLWALGAILKIKLQIVKELN